MIDYESKTWEDEEDEMINLANKLAKKKLEDGTASDQLIKHYIQLGCRRERLEQERIRKENLLIEAKISRIEVENRADEDYAAVVRAIMGYRGNREEEDDNFDEFEED